MIVPTFTQAIYIAGDLDTARAVCRRYCMEVGLCVTVEPVEFIYTGGAETGVRVGLINYPRFPAEPAEIEARAVALAERLRTELCQHSYSIVGSSLTVWSSTRERTDAQDRNHEHQRGNGSSAQSPDDASVMNQNPASQ